MDLLSECANNYKKLLNVKYRFIIGKKGRALSYYIIFRPIDFHHLIGLQYLTDILSLKRKDRETTFSSILNGTVSFDNIVQSKFYDSIADRIKLVSELQEHIESDDLFFKFYVKRIRGSSIDADFLLVRDDVHIFLSKADNFTDNCDQLYCKSAFINETDHYTQNQEKWVILKKTKINIDTDEEKIIYINPAYKDTCRLYI